MPGAKKAASTVRRNSSFSVRKTSRTSKELQGKPIRLAFYLGDHHETGAKAKAAIDRGKDAGRTAERTRSGPPLAAALRQLPR